VVGPASLRKRFTHVAGISVLFILDIVFLVLPHFEQALDIDCFHSAKSAEHFWVFHLGGCDEQSVCLFKKENYRINNKQKK